MGRSSTPAFVVEYTYTSGTITPYCWRSRRIGQVPADGKPSPFTLKRHVDSVNESLLPGGVNHYPTPGRADIRITSARLVRNDGSREVIATYDAGDTALVTFLKNTDNVCIIGTC